MSLKRILNDAALQLHASQEKARLALNPGCDPSCDPMCCLHDAALAQTQALEATVSAMECLMNPPAPPVPEAAK